MVNSSFRIKQMTREELNIAIDWAAKEGWNPGPNDADCYFSADPNGFFIGLLDDEPIAAISAVKYSDSFGFLGFYMVKPEYRGKGYGIQIWNAGLKYLEGLNLGLDGVVEQQENYKKSGFKLAYRNIRFEGTGGGEPPASGEIVNLSALPFEAIDDYDRPFFPANRSRFTKQWISQPACHALGIMVNDKLAGYGVMRKCLNGYKIAPLFADTPDLAESLFLALKTEASSSDPVFLDVPEVNQAAVSLAKQYSMKVAFETARMYTGDFPDLPFDRLFGITSFEIG